MPGDGADAEEFAAWSLYKLREPLDIDIRPYAVPLPRGGHACIGVGSRLLVVFGGEGSVNGRLEKLNDLLVLHVAARHWSIPRVNRHNLPEPRSGHSLTLVARGPARALLFGGLGARRPLQDLWRLDVGVLMGKSQYPVKPWERIAAGGTPPRARYWHAAAYVKEADRLYVHGGLDTGPFAARTALSDLHCLVRRDGPPPPAALHARRRGQGGTRGRRWRGRARRRFDGGRGAGTPRSPSATSSFSLAASRAARARPTSPAAASCPVCSTSTPSTSSTRARPPGAGRTSPAPPISLAPAPGTRRRCCRTGRLRSWAAGPPRPPRGPSALPPSGPCPPCVPGRGPPAADGRQASEEVPPLQAERFEPPRVHVLDPRALRWRAVEIRTLTGRFPPHLHGQTAAALHDCALLLFGGWAHDVPSNAAFHVQLFGGPDDPALRLSSLDSPRSPRSPGTDAPASPGGPDAREAFVTTALDDPAPAPAEVPSPDAPPASAPTPAVPAPAAPARLTVADLGSPPDSAAVSSGARSEAP